MSAFRDAVAASLATAFCFVAGAQSPASPAASVAPAAATPAPAFVSIGDRPALAYDSPSHKGVRLFIFSRQHPLEVLVRLGGWTKVRDVEGSVGWIETTSIGTRRFVMVTSAVAQVRTAPQAGAATVLEAERGVLLEISGGRAEGWIPVAHRDGQAGFVSAQQVFGG